VVPLNARIVPVGVRRASKVELEAVALGRMPHQARVAQDERELPGDHDDADLLIDRA